MGRWGCLGLLAWLCLLYCTGLWVFTRGFLLNRSEIVRNSSCADFPAPPGLPTPPGSATPNRSCWSVPARYRRAVLVVIDALRLDFATYDAARSEPKPYENRLPALHAALQATPRHARLFRFRADPPTTTMQRLKALATGGLPTFIDVSSNFASARVEEDNLVGQLVSAGRKLVFLGDDTWMGLFPTHFHRAFPFPSLNVRDLHSVDDGILQHLHSEVAKSDWDVIIAHFLGVDHVGHRLGPLHPAMSDKLSQMNEVLSNLLRELPEDAVLLVMGDHGMTETGDHGGESERETSAALFVYSPIPVFKGAQPREPRTVFQTDLVPSMALLLGVPIPYSNLGQVIPEMFGGEDDEEEEGDGGLPREGEPIPADGESVEREESDLAQLPMHLQALHLNAQQVQRFLDSYAALSDDLPPDGLHALRRRFSEAAAAYNSLASSPSPGLRATAATARDVEAKLRRHLSGVRNLCVASWARFSVPAMFAGVALLLCACAASAALSQAAPREGLPGVVATAALVGAPAGAAVAAFAAAASGTKAELCLAALCGASVASLLAFVKECLGTPPTPAPAGPQEAGSKDSGVGASVTAVIASSGCLALRFLAPFSNSYLIQESQVLPFLIQSVAVWSLLSFKWSGTLTLSLPAGGGEASKSAQQQQQQAVAGSPALRRQQSWYIVALTLGLLCCSRLALTLRVCRDELTSCEPSTLLVPPPRQQGRSRADGLPLALAAASLFGVWALTRAALRHLGNLNDLLSPPTLLVRLGQPVALLCVCCHWALALLPERGRQASHVPEWAQEAFPRAVYGVVALGLLLLLWRPLAVYVKRRRGNAAAAGGSGDAVPFVDSLGGFAHPEERLRHVIPQIYRHVSRSLDVQLSSTTTPVAPAAAGADEGGGHSVAAFGLGSAYTATLLVLLTCLGLLLAMLHQPGAAPSFLLLFVQAALMLERRAAAVSLHASPAGDGAGGLLCVPLPDVAMWSLAACQFFYATGHLPTFPALQWNAAFVGFHGGHGGHVLPALLVGLNTYASHALFAAGLPLLLTWPFAREAGAARRSPADEGATGMEMRLHSHPTLLHGALLRLGATYLLLVGLQLTASVCAAAVLRRHLMVWGIFAPKFLFEAVGFVVNGACLLLGVAFVLRVDAAVAAFFRRLCQTLPY
ncbi:LOW QUALITY PROTEIN: GPI ethanolamine phosphate transferase 3-like [Lethenteron reissneri]|uniref:LOW QUALITY PROTEIN: GPI ethanolamine phosphate transferase 3-like n=1 Tax=Lethenteron reissneri TaxID=7753 RepID=UPI002AB66C5E|nr:LOW QUALITY PROTEIN: GPI ethanolamine phosphate transferase 3-like [Lethenteron reissneri]